MAEYNFDWINKEKTGKEGIDENGKYYIERVYGKEYCNCHPETCSHFGGVRYVDYEIKIYITN